MLLFFFIALCVCGGVGSRTRRVIIFWAEHQHDIIPNLMQCQTIFLAGEKKKNHPIFNRTTMFICWLISPYFFSLCACNWQSNVGSCRSDCQCRCRYRDQYRRVSSTYNFVFSFLSLLFDFSLSHLLVTPYFVLVAYSSPLSSPLLLFFSSLKLPLSPPP